MGYFIKSESLSWFGDYPQEYETILDALDKLKVFCVEKNNDGTLEFRERADDWNCATLTKDDVVALIGELIGLIK